MNIILFNFENNTASIKLIHQSIKYLKIGLFNGLKNAGINGIPHKLANSFFAIFKGKRKHSIVDFYAHY